MSVDIEKLSTEEVFKLYSKILKELKKRDVIHSNNLVGEMGEHLAILHYNKNPNLPKLQRAPVSAKNIDAISRDGERYSIKTTSGGVTGTFWGLESTGSEKKDAQRFEYVVIVILDKDYDLESIVEIDWDQFLKIKRWHSRMNAWNIPVNASLMKMAKKIL